MKAADKIAAEVTRDPSKALHVDPSKLRGNEAAESAVFEALKRLQEQKRRERAGLPPLAEPVAAAPSSPLATVVPITSSNRAASRAVPARKAPAPQAVMPTLVPITRTVVTATGDSVTFVRKPYGPGPRPPGPTVPAAPAGVPAAAGVPEASPMTTELIGYVMLVVLVAGFVMLSRVW